MQAAQSKDARVSIQNKRFTLVNNKNGEELFDLQALTLAKLTNVIAQYPEVVDQLRTDLRSMVDQDSAGAGERGCLSAAREVSFAGYKSPLLGPSNI